MSVMSYPDHAGLEVPPALSALDTFLAPFIKSSTTREKTLKKSTKQGSRPSSREERAARGDSRVVLSIFDVPPGLLTHAGEGELPISSQQGGAPDASDRAVAVSGAIESSTARRPSAGVTAVEAGKGLTCIRCGLSFPARPAQLSHFKSDLHMANLRRQLAGRPIVSQEEFDAALGRGGIDHADGGGGTASPDNKEEDSSGSDSDEAGPTASRGIDLELLPEEDDSGLVATETVAQMIGGGGDGGGNKRGRVKVDFSLQEGPRLTFLPRGSAWCFSLSSAALGMERGDDPWRRLDGLVAEEGGGANRLWAVVILRSGKFAAAVFEGQSVLCHKVFRRYTIRAKRGGSQSSYDSGGRKAQSAGAALRRYGEQALREDTRALLKEWEGPLKACRVVLTSVPKGMRTVLFDGKDAPFDRKDPRLRPVPFAVGKPVFEEVVAVHTRVTSIFFSDAASVPVEDLTASNEPAHTDGGNGKKQNTKRAVPATGGDVARPAVSQQHTLDAEPCPPSSQLIEACERGDADAAVALLDRLELDGDTATDAAGDLGGGLVPSAGWTAAEVVNHPDGLERLMTPLHVAAAGGHVAVLSALLERGANPQAEDVRGRVPYVLAANKDTRDAFRRARAGQPGRWDWAVARVPEPLTEELEQRQKEKLKEKEKEKKRRAKIRKKADKERAEEEARQRKEKGEAEAEERRKRGLAAVGHCDACGNALIEKKAFSRFDFRYCSSDCVNAHKRKLAADAADRRFNGEGGQK